MSTLDCYRFKVFCLNLKKRKGISYIIANVVKTVHHLLKGKPFIFKVDLSLQDSEPFFEWAVHPNLPNPLATDLPNFPAIW